MVKLQKAKNQDGSIRYFLNIPKYYTIRKTWCKGKGIDFHINSRGNLVLMDGGTVKIQVAKNSTGSLRHFITLPKHLVESNNWKAGFKIGFVFDEQMQVELIVEGEK